VALVNPNDPARKSATPKLGAPVPPEINACPEEPAVLKI